MGWTALLSIIDKLLSMLTVWQMSNEQKAAQNARDNLEDNPAGFFRRHFGGVPDDGSTTTTSTNKANPEGN